MLTIKNLSLYLNKDLRILLEDFNFSLQDQDKIAIIGEEGNGKSTLMKAIACPTSITDYVEIRGDIFTKGEIIGYLPQQIDSNLLDITTSDYFYSKIDFNTLDYNLLYRLLGQMKLNEDRISNSLRISNLSGGEKIKFQILCEMMNQPSIFLLDEPSNDLDLESIQWLEDFINSLTIPLIFISHDERLLENCSNGIIHIEQLMRKKVSSYTIERLPYKEYVKNRINKIDKQTQQARKDKEIFNNKMDRYRKIHDSVEHNLKSVSRQSPGAAKNLKDKMHSIKSMEKRFEKEKERLTQKPDFEKSINLHFEENIIIPNSKQILDFNISPLEIGDKFLSQSVSLSIYGPEKICIVGSNGCGKTTLVKLILDEFSKSKIDYSYMPQNYSDLMDPKESPIDFLKASSHKDEITKVRTYLASMNFTIDEMFHPLEELSGGQKAKLFFSKMILDESEFLILDEPTRNLSPLSRPEIIDSLVSYSGGILAISHDRSFISQVFDKVFVLDQNGLFEIEKSNI